MKTRRGLSLLEVVLGLAVLGVGLLPIFDILGSTRNQISRGREALDLQSVALEVLDQTRRKVTPLPPELRSGEEVVDHLELRGYRVKRTLTYVPRKRWIHARIRVESPERFFEITSLTAEVGASFLPPRGAP